MDITECVGGVMREIRETVRSQTVVGTPIRSGETTIIPVSRIAFGFGIFGGAGSRLKRREATGAGAGVSVEPVAFVVVAKGKPRLLSIKKRAADVSRRFEIVPPVLKLIMWVLRRRRNRRSAHA